MKGMGFHDQQEAVATGGSQWETPPPYAEGRAHLVKNGQTLWQIAAHYLGDGSRATEIARLNHLKDPNKLEPGQMLVLPEHGTTKQIDATCTRDRGRDCPRSLRPEQEPPGAEGRLRRSLLSGPVEGGEGAVVGVLLDAGQRAGRHCMDLPRRVRQERPGAVHQAVRGGRRSRWSARICRCYRGPASARGTAPGQTWPPLASAAAGVASYVRSPPALRSVHSFRPVLALRDVLLPGPTGGAGNPDSEGAMTSATTRRCLVFVSYLLLLAVSACTEAPTVPTFGPVPDVGQPRDAGPDLGQARDAGLDSGAATEAEAGRPTDRDLQVGADHDAASPGLGFLQPCQDGAQCASGLCLPGPEGRKACSRPCREDCPEGWECRALESEGGDAVLVCVHPASLCQPCDDSLAGCGGAGLCLPQGNGRFCSLPCEQPADCPPGYSCAVATPPEAPAGSQRCQPAAGWCLASCRDVDGDRYPKTLGVCARVKNACNGVSGWGEPSYAQVVGSDYAAAEVRCDGKDNDCDGLTDLEDPQVQAAQPLADKREGECAGVKKPCDPGAGGWREPSAAELFSATGRRYELAES
ncbi:MAG: LysM peptidoglycan-binding domain-containing protein, partial [Deltaproteobacteria bacterium]|nr:LysM peptidoglycan-binding domain-containing protein [Deltaproteobacteria bacterium]